jgi:hypothetical protein
LQIFVQGLGTLAVAIVKRRRMVFLSTHFFCDFWIASFKHRMLNSKMICSG